jgi:hypothetical protein
MSINRSNGSPPPSPDERSGSAGRPRSEPIRDEPSADASAPANRVRQGVTGHNVRYVLVFGIAGVVLAFIVIYVAFSG